MPKNPISISFLSIWISKLNFNLITEKNPRRCQIRINYVEWWVFNPFSFPYYVLSIEAVWWWVMMQEIWELIWNCQIPQPTAIWLQNGKLIPLINSIEKTDTQQDTFQLEFPWNTSRILVPYHHFPHPLSPGRKR